ncbi:hypothetical protein KGA66_22875 [Actinocrinis puniceicyclus]|uniref:Capsular polysaccharide biosynthesis protein n=1 Tax=Actinocrinis puniceicyclus TaxID=977794 RepID=A0A8J7WNZ8_9ACTN|nr:hypothetical protein [Actinocrinis puniceicyclus]MBS2965908.1 hypothetical protein [Actinocrinis puniceicyclus]
MTTVRRLGRSLRQRWYVALPLAALTLAATAAVAHTIPTEYRARAMVGLLAAHSGVQGRSGRPQYGNPFLAFGAALTDTADLLTRRLDSPTAASRLRAEGATDSYAASLAADAPGPFITLTVTGVNRAQVAASLHTLLGYTAQQLTAIQARAGVSPASMIRSFVIIAPTRPATQPARKVPAVLGVAIAGLVASVLSALLAESIAAARRARRAAAMAEPGTLARA